MGFLKVTPDPVQPSTVRPFGDTDDIGRLGVRQAVKMQKEAEEICEAEREKHRHE